MAQFGRLLLYAQCSGVELFRFKLKSLFLRSLLGGFLHLATSPCTNCGVELFRFKLKSLFLRSLSEWVLAFGCMNFSFLMDYIDQRIV